MANKMYHISPKTGRANQCTATIRGCQFAENGQMPEHYETKEEARKAYENQNKSKTVQSLKKSVKTDPNAAGTTIEEDDFTRSIKVKGFPNFNPASDNPKDFDIALATVNERFLDATARRNRADSKIQNIANPKQYNSRTARSEYTLDKGKVLAEFRQQENPSARDKQLIEEWEKAEKESTENAILKTKIERVYRKRGSWNRAFLVPDGHLHKSTDCSTCNKGETPTKFEFMTDYSGKDEKQIVGDAGHRACTTCYPSAPLGTEKSLPSKMMTKDEAERAKEQNDRREALAKKKAAAANNAPTASGKPLTARIGRYNETFKTERSASQWYVAGIADGPPRNEADAEQLKNVRYKVLYNLALKNDKPLSEMKEEFDKKAEAKSKRDYKESEKHFKMLGALNADSPGSFQLREYETPEVDKYDVPEELMNKSPREWDNANQYIPED